MLSIGLSCSQKPKQKEPVDLSQVNYRKPDSLVALVKLTVYEKKKKKNIQGVISILPEKRYKLELKGLMNKHLGTFYWVKDSTWALYVPSEKIIYAGEPESVSFPVFDLENVYWKPFFDALWNGLIPQGDKEGLGATGYLSFSEKQGYRIEYKELHVENQRVVPQRISLFFKGEKQLEMKYKKIRDNPKLKKSPFYLNIPKGVAISE